MKPAASQSADLPNSESTLSVALSAPITKYVTVYSFYVYDHDQNKTVIYPRMATPATVAKMRGKLNEETAWIVDATSLDIEGFYSGTAP